MWIEFELKDKDGIIWKAIFDTKEIKYMQLSKDKCSVQVGGLGEIKFNNSVLGLSCYEAFISVIKHNLIVHIDEIGYINPI